MTNPNCVEKARAALGGADPMSETNYTRQFSPEEIAQARAVGTHAINFRATSPEAGAREGSRKKQNDWLQRGDMARNLSTGGCNVTNSEETPE